MIAQDLELKDKPNREYHRAYQSTPEYKAQRKAYSASRRVRDREAARMKKFRELPEFNELERIRRKEYYQRPSSLVKRRKWYSSAIVRKRVSDQRAIRRKSDPAYAITNALRARLYAVVKNSRGRKIKSTLDLVGCDAEFLAKHIESKFKEGMTWENRSEWHIDHIIPCSKFNMLYPEDQGKCFHYSNLQPLWWWENLSKSDKTEDA